MLFSLHHEDYGEAILLVLKGQILLKDCGVVRGHSGVFSCFPFPLPITTLQYDQYIHY